MALQYRVNLGLNQEAFPVKPESCALQFGWGPHLLVRATLGEVFLYCVVPPSYIRRFCGPEHWCPFALHVLAILGGWCAVFWLGRRRCTACKFCGWIFSSKARQRKWDRISYEEFFSRSAQGYLHPLSKESMPLRHKAGLGWLRSNKESQKSFEIGPYYSIAFSAQKRKDWQKLFFN